jgi:hypothetical protein
VLCQQCSQSYNRSRFQYEVWLAKFVSLYRGCRIIECHIKEVCTSDDALQALIVKEPTYVRNKTLINSSCSHTTLSIICTVKHVRASEKQESQAMGLKFCCN